eukprot:UN09979
MNMETYVQVCFQNMAPLLDIGEHCIKGIVDVLMIIYNDTIIVISVLVSWVLCCLVVITTTVLLIRQENTYQAPCNTYDLFYVVILVCRCLIISNIFWVHVVCSNNVYDLNMFVDL